MSQHERYTTLRATVTEATPGTISGIALAYGKPIQRGERLFEQVNKGAFKAQLAAANRVPVLWQHDPDSPIGRATKLTDTEDTLTFEAKLTDNEDVPDARRALALLREGVIDEVSVGFEWGSWAEERDGDRLTIVHTKARLREFSVVTFGALGRDARVLTVATEGPGVNVAAYRARLAALTA